MGRVFEVIARSAGAAVLVAAAWCTPMLGLSACEYYEGRRFFGMVESDWLMAAALLGGGACLIAAARLLRGVVRH